MSLLADRLAALPGPDTAASGAVSERAAQVLRPPGALERLDSIASWVAGWQRTVAPAVRAPAGLVFAADHGVAANAPVSAYPSDVTTAMVAAFDRQMSTMSVFARHVGAHLTVVDVGVGTPTGDIRHEPALDAERFDDVTQAAFDAVDELDADLLVLGELGIGNTTVSAAVAAAVIGGEPVDWVGRGTGVDDDGLAIKRDVVRTAVERVAGLTDPIEVLREVGGAELVGMAAAVVAARHRSLPVVLDGYICTAAAFPLHETHGAALDHCIVGHRSAEPGHRLLLDRIGKEPLLDLDMRLGEGSGAMAAVPLVRLACAGVVEVPTFAEFFAADGPNATS